MMLMLSTGTIFHVSVVHASTSYTVHSPIQIIGNSEFNQPNGVTGGKGTRSDPYLIEGWSIAALNGQSAIRIESTTAYFLILHVQLLNPQFGIYLTDVANGSVKNSTLTGSYSAIRIESSNNIIISGNNITGTGNGILELNTMSGPLTSGLTIENNTFSGAGVDVGSSRPNISGNTFFSSGVDTGASFGASVVRNLIIGPPYGAGLTVEGNNSIVSDNVVTDGDILVWGSGTIVRNNTADRIILGVATQIQLLDNALTRGVLIQPNPPFTTPPFYDSHIMSGNTVNGKPLLYFARCSGPNIDGTIVGEVIVASCTNVRVTNLQLSGSDDGIMMVYVRHGSILNNNLSGSYVDHSFTGVDILHSSDVQISNNDINGTDVSISDTDNVTVTGNLGHGSTFSPSVTISGGTGISVWNNTFERNAGALSLVDVINATVAANWLSDNGNGIVVSGANGLNITANNLVRNGQGLSLDGGDLNGIFNSIIYHNNFVDNSRYQAVYYPPLVAVFDNGYPSGGNYWSDYRGFDNCSGPDQSICNGPDGIGDKPYSGIWRYAYSRGSFGGPGDLLDNYPLVSPYGNFSWDTAPPTWPSGGGLTISIVNSTSLTLHWTAAVDNAWISVYRVYQDGTLVATLPGYAQNYTIAGLSPGSTHVFKLEAGDPARNWSTDGPSASATLSQSFFTMAWWTEHWYIGILIGGVAVLAVSGIFLVRRKKP